MSQAKDINIRKQATISFTGNIADAGISFLGLIAMAYVLGAEELGRYYLILAVIEVALFPVIGLGQAVLKRGSEESQDPAEIFGTGLSMAMGYVAVVVAPLAIILFSGSVSIGYRPDVVLAAIAVFVTQAAMYVQIDSYRSYGHTGYATLVDNTYGILQTVLQLVVLWLGFRTFGLLLVTAIAILLTTVTHYLVSVVEISRPRLVSAYSLLEYGRWSMVTAGISKLYKRLPELALGFLGMNAAVGYYTSADRLLMLGSYVSGSLAPALMAKTSSQTSRGTGPGMLEEFKQVHHHASILSVAFAFGSFALAGPLMQTFFDMSDPMAVSALVVLSFYHIISTLVIVEYSFFDGLNRPDFRAKSTTLGLVVQLVLVPVLFSQFGFVGVVASIVLSHFVILVYAQVIIFSEFDTVLILSGLVKQVLSGVVMFLCVTLVEDLIDISSVFHLLVIVAFGAVVYISTLILVDSAFRALLQESLRELSVAQKIRV